MQEMDSQVTLDAESGPESGILSDDMGLNFQRPIRVPVNKTDECYKMDHDRRGRAIIFCQVNFEEHLNLEKRKDGKKSAQELETALKTLGFEAVIREDLTFKEIKGELEEIAKDEDKALEKEDCILIAVMTHGGNEDQLYAKDTHYTSRYLHNPFQTSVCSGLAGKPKIFILQACRGTGGDDGIQLQRNARHHSSIQIDGVPSRIEDYKLPKYADFLTAYSSTSTFVAFRKPFIQALSEELSSENVKTGEIDFLSMLTNVLRKVAIGEHDSKSKQMPSVTSTLTRKIFFPTKSNVNLNEKNSGNKGEEP